MWLQGGVDEKLDRASLRAVFGRLAPLVAPYRRQVIGAVLSVALWVTTVLAGPFLVRLAIDRGILEGRADVLRWCVVAYVGVAVTGYVLSRRQIVMINEVGENLLRDLRVRVFDHLQRLGLPFHDRTPSGVIVSRMTADIDSMQELVQTGLLLLVSNLLLLTLSVTVLAVVSWQLLLVCFIAVPFVIVASVKFQRDSNRAYLDVRDQVGATLARLQESIGGVRVIQAYWRAPVEVRRFRDQNGRLFDAHMNSVKIQAWYIPIIEFAGVGTTALVVGVGGWLVTRDVLTVGTVAFFVLTLGNLFEPVQHLSQLFNVVQSAAAALNKIFTLLDEPVDIDERDGAVELPARGAITVSGVGFGYRAGETILDGVDLTVAPGERMALVGPTGAGKSTLAKLMARFYDPTTGAVAFGGVDLRDATLRSLRDRIVLVPQEGFLFNGTVRENVRIAKPDATDAEVDDALDRLGVGARFAELEQGLDTEVRERGARLSAGEKQLVSLARASLVDPAVLLLDEATSSLDPGTELIVERALESLLEGRTVLVIAHRLSTAERADRVAVVDGGVLAELGTHEDLVGRGGRYADLYSTWQAN